MLPAQVSYWTLQETKQHNRAQERQAVKELDEQILAHRNAESIQRQALIEQKRHAVNTEILSTENLRELTRHNKATEGYQYGNLEVARGNLTESIRSHMASEAIGRLQAQASLQHATAALRQAGASESQAATAEKRRHDDKTYRYRSLDQDLQLKRTDQLIGTGNMLISGYDTVSRDSNAYTKNQIEIGKLKGAVK